MRFERWPGGSDVLDGRLIRRAIEQQTMAIIACPYQKLNPDAEGRAISLALACCGAHLLLTARTRRELEQTAAEIAAAGGTSSVEVVDVAEEA